MTPPRSVFVDGKSCEKTDVTWSCWVSEAIGQQAQSPFVQEPELGKLLLTIISLFLPLLPCCLPSSTNPTNLRCESARHIWRLFWLRGRRNSGKRVCTHFRKNGVKKHGFPEPSRHIFRIKLDGCGAMVARFLERYEGRGDRMTFGVFWHYLAYCGAPGLCMANFSSQKKRIC